MSTNSNLDPEPRYYTIIFFILFLSTLGFLVVSVLEGLIGIAIAVVLGVVSPFVVGPVALALAWLCKLLARKRKSEEQSARTLPTVFDTAKSLSKEEVNQFNKEIRNQGKKENTKTAKEWFRLGFEAKNTEKKVNYYTKTLEIDPKNACAWYNKGLALDKLGRYEAAIDCFDNALAINPSFKEARKGKEDAEKQIKQTVIDRCDKAPKIDPKDAAAWRTKGDTLTKLGKYEDAIDCFDKVLKINPKDTYVWVAKGNALCKLGKYYKDAIDCFDRALEIDPKDAAVWHIKGYALRKLRKNRVAIDCYDRALEIDPKDAAVWNSKGIVFYKLEKYQAAIDCFDKALEIDPKYSFAWHNKGNSLRKLDKHQIAIDCYDKALEIKPSFEVARKGKEDAEKQIRDKKIKDLRSKLQEIQDKLIIPQSIHAQIKLFKEGDHKIDIDGLKRLLDEAANTIPEIELSLKDKSFTLNRWDKLALEIRNNSIAHAFNLIPSFSDDIEVRRIKPVTVKGKESITLEIFARAKYPGRIPLDIKVQFEDSKGNKHEKIHEVWIEVSENVKEEIRPAEILIDLDTAQTLGLSEEAQERYIFIKKLGQGGMGIVYLAQDKMLERKVALKVLPQELISSPIGKKRLLKEARAAARLSHPGIVIIHDVGMEKGQNYISMEYIEGESLDETLAEKHYLPLSEVMRIIVPVCKALDYAHKERVIHRDIKPSNIMVSKEGGVKVTDFGIAQIVGEALSSSHRYTPRYASPEQILGKKTDARSDIYSLGVMLYELLTGSAPFISGDLTYQHLNIRPELPSKARVGITGEIDGITLKCLEKKPEDRYQSISQLLQALNGIDTNETLSGKKTVSSDDTLGKKDTI